MSPHLRGTREHSCIEGGNSFASGNGMPRLGASRLTTLSSYPGAPLLEENKIAMPIANVSNQATASAAQLRLCPHPYITAPTPLGVLHNVWHNPRYRPDR